MARSPGCLARSRSSSTSRTGPRRRSPPPSELPARRSRCGMWRPPRRSCGSCGSGGLAGPGRSGPGRAGGPGGRAPGGGGAAARAIAAGRPGDPGEQSVLPVADLVKAPGELAAAIERLLNGVLFVPDLAAGLELVRRDPAVTVVTADGDLLGGHWARGGSPGGQSLLGLRSAAAQAAGELARAEAAGARAERELADAVDEEERARGELARALAALQEVDAAAAEVS